jgi:hypothetical protein
MKIPTTKIVTLYCIFISFLTLYLIPTNITPVIASIKFPISSILYPEKCQQAEHLINKMTISGFMFPQISTDCQMNYELTVIGNDAYRGTANLFITIKQASAAGQTNNTGSDSESNSYPVYKIIILIIAFVGAPAAILTLRSIINRRDANGLQSNAKVEVEIRGGSKEEELGAENRELGFAIEHPSDWPLVNETLSPGQVMFKPRDSIMPMFVVKTADLKPYLDIQTMTVRNKTLDQIVQEFTKNTTKPNSFGLETKIVRQNQIAVGGNPGVKLEMMMSVGPASESDMYAYLFYVLTIANGKVYSLEYDEKPLKVPESLTVALQMLDSFRII